MSQSLITCTKCNASLVGEVLGTPELVPCPSCGAAIKVDLFPAYFKGPVKGQVGENLLVEGESGCFYHPQKKAVVPCEACGRFLCALCDCELNGQHLCPVCLETGKKKGRLKNLQNHRTLYDNLALALAVGPLLIFYLTIVTAPMALYFALRYWSTPSSVIQRSKIRFVIAIAIASAEILAWAVGIYFFVNRAS
ncbi:MAG TPA: hypothetical protein VEL06_14130 [Haliangiales bacterium]|nr:hypothetical protein [Haliangiales bacterium]